MSTQSDENKQAPAPRKVRRYRVHATEEMGVPSAMVDVYLASDYDALQARVRELEGALRAVIDSIPTTEFYTNVNQAQFILSKERT